MRATTMSRIVAAFAALALAGGCSDGSGGLDPNSKEDPIPGTLTLAPQVATIRPGQVLFLKATLADELGRPFPGVGITWSSSNTAVATVSAAGTVSGTGEGDAVITARLLGRALSSTIHVLRPAPKPQILVNIRKGGF